MINTKTNRICFSLQPIKASLTESETEIESEVTKIKGTGCFIMIDIKYLLSAPYGIM